MLVYISVCQYLLCGGFSEVDSQRVLMSYVGNANKKIVSCETYLYSRISWWMLMRYLFFSVCLKVLSLTFFQEHYSYQNTDVFRAILSEQPCCQCTFRISLRRRKVLFLLKGKGMKVDYINWPRAHRKQQKRLSL